MNSQVMVSAMLGTGVLATLGTWAEGKELTVRPVVGGTFLALFLAGLSEASPELAGRLALLVLLAAAFRYVPPILAKSGLTK
ncbi:MAG TPA: hypothetical protein VFI97_03620 [Arthrobacter sp.]|nr:hypothetical protein [Arthrobacter sp.]